MSILHNTIIHFVSDRNNNKIYIRIMVEIIVNVVFPGYPISSTTQATNWYKQDLRLEGFHSLKSWSTSILLKTRDDAYKVTKNSYGNWTSHSNSSGWRRVVQPMSEMPMLLSVWPTGGQCRPHHSCRVWTVKLEPGERAERRAESIIMQQKQELPLTSVLLGWSNKDIEEITRHPMAWIYQGNVLC